MDDHIAATRPGTALAAACSHTASSLLASPAVLTHFTAINAALGHAKRPLVLSLLVHLAGAPDAPPPEPHAKVFALTATAVLMAGPKEVVPGTTSQALSTLQPCALMRDPLLARALLGASARVLARTRGAGQPRGSAERHRLQLQSWPFTQNVFLLDLLQAGKADMSCWAPPDTGSDDSSWDGMDAIICAYHAWVQVRPPFRAVCALPARRATVLWTAPRVRAVHAARAAVSVGTTRTHVRNLTADHAHVQSAAAIRTLLNQQGSLQPKATWPSLLSDIPALPRAVREL